MIRTEVVDFSVLRKDYEETDTFSFLGEVQIPAHLTTHSAKS